MDNHSRLHADRLGITAFEHPRKPNDVDERREREWLVRELEDAYLQCEAVKRRLVVVEGKLKELEVVKCELVATRSLNAELRETDARQTRQLLLALEGKDYYKRKLEEMRAIREKPQDDLHGLQTEKALAEKKARETESRQLQAFEATRSTVAPTQRGLPATDKDHRRLMTQRDQELQQLESLNNINSMLQRESPIEPLEGRQIVGENTAARVSAGGGDRGNLQQSYIDSFSKRNPVVGQKNAEERQRQKSSQLNSNLSSTRSHTEISQNRNANRSPAEVSAGIPAQTASPRHSMPARREEDRPCQSHLIVEQGRNSSTSRVTSHLGSAGDSSDPRVRVYVPSAPRAMRGLENGQIFTFTSEIQSRIAEFLLGMDAYGSLASYNIANRKSHASTNSILSRAKATSNNTVISDAGSTPCDATLPSSSTSHAGGKGARAMRDLRRSLAMTPARDPSKPDPLLPEILRAKVGGPRPWPTHRGPLQAAFRPPQGNFRPSHRTF